MQADNFDGERLRKGINARQRHDQKEQGIEERYDPPSFQILLGLGGYNGSMFAQQRLNIG